MASSTTNPSPSPSPSGNDGASKDGSIIPVGYVPPALVPQIIFPTLDPVQGIVLATCNLGIAICNVLVSPVGQAQWEKAAKDGEKLVDNIKSALQDAIDGLKGIGKK